MKTIKDLPEHSRPREKLQEQGAAALTDKELVAAILGMGTAGEPALAPPALDDQRPACDCRSELRCSKAP